MLPASTIYLPFSQNATMNKCKWRCWWGTTRWKNSIKYFFDESFSVKSLQEKAIEFSPNLSNQNFALLHLFKSSAIFRNERMHECNTKKGEMIGIGGRHQKRIKWIMFFFLDIIHLQSAHQQLKQIINLLIKDFC